MKVKNMKIAREFITWMRKLLRSTNKPVYLTDREMSELQLSYDGVKDHLSGWHIARGSLPYTARFHNELVDIFNDALEPAKPYDATKLEFVS